ncbi:MAG: hypothetical protein CL583_02980 [Alteromonadaceae bacterium]|nr:hypothetical protein [Alteromonadaceae bacterium]|tara:strand:- start:1556 stop:2956 length:1401 start_codon:yes stop_codon:yes gene_type:complete
MKKIGLTIIVAVVLLAVGTYVAIWCGADQFLSRVKSDIAEKGVLTWQGVNPRLDGSVEVRDLELTLFELSQPIRVASATLSMDSAATLVNWLLRPTGVWPDNTRLEVSQAQLIVRPALTKDWLTQTDDTRAQWPRPWHLRACGARTQLGGTDLLSMGIDRLEVDLTLHWLGATRDGYELVGELNGNEIGSVDFRLQGEELPIEWAQLADAGLTGWPSMQLVVRDGGFMRRLSAYCAKPGHKDPSGWASAETEALQRDLKQWGIALSPELASLYQSWLHEGGEIAADLPVKPKAEVADINTLAAYFSRDDLLVQHNGRPLAQVGFEVDKAIFLAVTEPASVQPAAVEPAVADHLAWRQTPLATADHWLGRQIRVEMAAGHSLEGHLSDINNRQLIILRRVAGGEFASPAARADVSELHVLRRLDELPPVLEEMRLRDAAGRRSGPTDHAPAQFEDESESADVGSPIF